ncbi:fatty acid desaturase family protein [Streptomyces sp. NPDC008001]|uniref:fatty acid desaturase family protein n=1 Tax=Streptomyces sp. NPDC008001 TaxID=3364804 RepID=UPI0036E5A6D1
MSRTAPHEEEQLDFDGSRDVALAPVRGTDTRRGLPAAYFARHPRRFLAKVAVAFAVIVVCWTALLEYRNPVTCAAAVLVLGVMYAYLVELQHECLHEHAFHARWANRSWGFVCGVFMFSSYSHYKYEHLRHHAFLGTPRNQEFFNYRFHGLDSVHGFALAAFHPGRYADVLRNLARGAARRPVPGVERPRAARAVQNEYALLLVLLAAAVAAGVLTRDWFVVLAWFAPVLLVSEAAHFLIEMPEHFGLNTQTDPDVLSNTRTIHASRFGRWLTNYNNLHTAHHYHQGVPMVNVPELHEAMKDRILVTEPSYWSFYRKVLKGEIAYQGGRARDETCMTR